MIKLNIFVKSAALKLKIAIKDFFYFIQFKDFN